MLPSHFGAVVGQSVSRRHWTHFSSDEQNGVAVFLQSIAVRHCTQAERFGSHSGAVAGQSPFDLQPVRHFNSSASQIGVADGQSEFDKHCTQLPRKHFGAVAPQSLLPRQATHCFVRSSQKGRPAGQSVFVMQPTH